MNDREVLEEFAHCWEHEPYGDAIRNVLAENERQHQVLIARGEENERLRARIDARIDAALALHKKQETYYGDYCMNCHEGPLSYDLNLWSWPCPTVKALRGEE